MSDIVRRLREVTGFVRAETGDRLAAASSISEEAADEIERLQSFIDDAFEAHSNLGLDVENVRNSKEALSDG